MKIEITSEQFNQIQDEIIRLEEELSNLIHDEDTWAMIAVSDRIETLKEILSTEQIDLNKIN